MNGHEAGRGAPANRADLQRRIEQMREASEERPRQEGENRLRTHRSFSMRRRGLVTELEKYAAHQQDERFRDSPTARTTLTDALARRDA